MKFGKGIRYYVKKTKKRYVNLYDIGYLAIGFIDYKKAHGPTLLVKRD